MKQVLRATLVGLVTLILVYILIGAVAYKADVPFKQLVPLPSLETAPDYHEYAPISNAHCTTIKGDPINGSLFIYTIHVPITDIYCYNHCI